MIDFNPGDLVEWRYMHNDTRLSNDDSVWMSSNDSVKHCFDTQLFARDNVMIVVGERDHPTGTNIIVLSPVGILYSRPTMKLCPHAYGGRRVDRCAILGKVIAEEKL